MYSQRLVVNGIKLREIIIKPFFEIKSCAKYKSYIGSSPDLIEMKSGEELMIEITKGHEELENLFAIVQKEKLDPFGFGLTYRTIQLHQNI
ncbi:hypothetical protein WAX74_14390 [Psychrobacillus sp. FJAT-51614]|uniref:Uncharacterized protein n=1 Tax=Psychrobacillus mangrovi TaxID=3117745 RepID=A0ABU8F762_9BACI